MTEAGLKLTAKSPCAGLLPLKIGKLTAEELAHRSMYLVAPFKGQDAALDTAMKAAHGVGVPAPGTSTQQGDASALWFGKGQTMLIGAAPGAALAAHAAISDQSDAWACVRLSGAGVELALSRLVPMDLRVGQFLMNATARTLIGHMNGSVTRTGAYSFELMVFRSMASTLVHDLTEAMETVAAGAGSSAP